MNWTRGRATIGVLLCILALALGAGPAASQVLHPRVAPAGEAAAAPVAIEDLTPDQVDALLARLTDAEIRALLRDELTRRAEARAAAETAPMTGAALQARLSEMSTRVAAQVGRWRSELPALGQRGEQVRARLSLAENGVPAMIASALALLAGAVVAAWAVMLLTRGWRRRLVATAGVSYWDRVARTIALTLLELAPVAAFSFALATLTPLFGAALGPLQTTDISYVWIFQTGVANGWGGIVLARRAFAPDAPQIRIADVPDAAAERIYALLRRAAFVGMGGWLFAGLAPTFGLGFAPATLIVALSGSAVFAMLLLATALNTRAISSSIGRALGLDPRQGGAAALAAAAAPWALGLYLALAWAYWLATWMATGQQALLGPLGTLLIGLALPALDRLGSELARAGLGRSTSAARYHRVLLGAWRVVIGLAAAVLAARLWGLDLFALAKGPTAPAWASAVFDIAVTLLIGQLVWRLIQAALYQERRVSTGDQEDQSEEIGGASRLQTLVPLLRNMLLMALSIVVLMIVLSSLGVDIGPLLASAGIIGIAIGFGAQTLVRDIFSGIFFLIDDAFRVGEYIELDQDLRGEVEAISIRSLQLRHHRGAVVTIPFGELKQVTNHNRDWVIYKMPFRLEPDTRPEEVKKIVKRIGAELLEDPEHGPKFLEPLKSQGVFMIDDDSALVIRVKFKCKPRMQFVLRREVYHRLREAFAEHGIRLARRKVEVVGGDAGAGAAAAAEATGPDASKFAAAADSQ